MTDLLLGNVDSAASDDEIKALLVIPSDVVAIGSKGAGFLSRIGARIVSQIAHLGDTPHLERLIGPVKVLLDAYQNGDIDAVYLFYTRFINTMTQEPVMDQLIPLSADRLKADRGTHSWDYIYEHRQAGITREISEIVSGAAAV